MRLFAGLRRALSAATAWPFTGEVSEPENTGILARPRAEPSRTYADDEGYLDEAKLEDYDPEVDGLPALELMRREACQIDPRNAQSLMVHGVGGFVEHVSITRTGVERRIIREWPDEIGRTIQPEASGKYANDAHYRHCH